MKFFRFPHTPHLAWLAQGAPRDDKVLSPDEAEKLLSGELVVEEKIDGANIGFSAAEDGELLIQSRGSYLERKYLSRQFRPLLPWLHARESMLFDALWPSRILFGEWCYAVHSVVYRRLPDWFLGFDVYDASVGRFWDTSRRDALLTKLRLHRVPRLAKGQFDIGQLERLLSRTSSVGEGAMEGVIVRKESHGFTTGRAKLVRAEFTQAIDQHWSRSPLRHNELADEAMPSL